MIFWQLLALAIGLNLAGFLIAFWRKSDKLTDFSYGATFITLAAVAYGASNKSVVNILLLVLVVAWALRLAGFLLLRVLKNKKDKRFDGVREDFWKFGRFWLFQGITVWLILLPAIYLFAKSPVDFGWLTWVGSLVALAGLLIESVADLQKFNFNQNPANKGQWIATGLWAKSRHPNYFGEITMWVGVYLLSFPFLVGAEKLIALISPAYIAFLLIFVTGIPKLEKYADQKWGDDPKYRAYKKHTPILIPKL